MKYKFVRLVICFVTLASLISCQENFGGDGSKEASFALLRTKGGSTGKSVVNCSSSELQCVAFVLSHEMEKGHKPAAKDMISISALEKITGFTYFTNVPNAPKDSFNANDWL